MTNLGRYDLELVRVSEKEKEGQSPWQMVVQRIRLDWRDTSISTRPTVFCVCGLRESRYGSC